MCENYVTHIVPVLVDSFRSILIFFEWSNLTFYCIYQDDTFSVVDFKMLFTMEKVSI